MELTIEYRNYQHSVDNYTAVKYNKYLKVEILFVWVLGSVINTQV